MAHRFLVFVRSLNLQCAPDPAVYQVPVGKPDVRFEAFDARVLQAATQPWNVPRKSARNSRHGLPGEGP